MKFNISLLGLLVIVGCGQEVASNADRPALGTGTNAAVTQTTQSLTSTTSAGVQCAASPSSNPVVSGTQININVTVTGAKGAVSIPGYVTNGTAASYQLPVTYTNTGSSNVLLTRTVQLTDSYNIASCSFSLTVEPSH